MLTMLLSVSSMAGKMLRSQEGVTAGRLHIGHARQPDTCKPQSMLDADWHHFVMAEPITSGQPSRMTCADKHANHPFA